MISDGITVSSMSRRKVDPFGLCSLRVKANSVLCLQCGEWNHGRCAWVRGVTQRLSGNFACRKCVVNIGEAVEQGETLCDEVETVK